MVSQEDKLDGFGGIIQVYVAVRLRVLVAPDGPHEEVLPCLALRFHGGLVCEWPALDVEGPSHQRNADFLTWGSEQIATYRAKHANGTMARLALELMLNIAARRHDACLIGRQHLRNARLTWRPHKTSRSTGKILTIRVLPELQSALDAMPPSNALPFVLNDYGRPSRQQQRLATNLPTGATRQA